MEFSVSALLHDMPCNRSRDASGKLRERPKSHTRWSFEGPLRFQFAFGARSHSESSEAPHSHSIVAGGFPEMSYTTRDTPGTSFTILLEQTSNNS